MLRMFHTQTLIENCTLVYTPDVDVKSLLNHLKKQLQENPTALHYKSLDESHTMKITCFSHYLDTLKTVQVQLFKKPYCGYGISKGFSQFFILICCLIGKILIFFNMDGASGRTRARQWKFLCPVDETFCTRDSTS
ncbi:hypothetical protein AVEN_59953-1 [Araneus ventricosus]|uniref:Uncharacterized protein n=1 Tax=Araneus ventricosus TaxID=182803 RepID=A0A4Y2Q7A9_ARAVE|nr:hypothetical protein AVEN_59953-1 [Araneus ventricosus]